MRRILTLVVATVVSMFGIAAVAAPAEAATGVTIRTIKAPTAAYLGTATVKPSVSTSGPVKVTSKTLTVKSGSKTLVSKKPSAKLKAGSYKLTTYVAYRVKKNGKYGATKRASRSQSLIVKAGAKNCATMEDYDSVVTVEMYSTDEGGTIQESDVDTAATAAMKLSSKGRSQVKVTLGDLYDEAVAQSDDETASTVQSWIDIYGRAAYFEVRDYAMCQSRSVVELIVIGGDVWHKEIVQP